MLADDPGERTDVAGQEPSVHELLLESVDDYLHRAEVGPRAPSLSEEQLERLRSLGYVQ